MTDRETIVAAAIRISVPARLREQTWNGKPLYPEYLTVTAPPPARHGTLLHPIIAPLEYVHDPANQGFITSTGRYVGRTEALAIVQASGQPQIEHPARNAGGRLFSEDLW